MGRAIFYCHQCSKRVSETDLDAGKASRIGERILCGECAPVEPKPATSKKMPAVARKPGGTSVAMRSPGGPPDEPEVSNWRLRIIVIAAGILFIAVVAVLMMRRGSAPPPVVVEEKPVPKVLETKPPEPVKPVETKETSARADLEKARASAKARPDNLSGQLREFTDIVWKWDGTDAAREAAKEAAAVKAAIQEKVAAWMADLEAQIKAQVDAKQYFAAVRRIEELKPTHDLAEWRLAAEKRASELYAIGKQLADAEEAKKPSEDAKSFLAAWEAAAVKATARDFGGAVTALEQAAPTIKDAAVKQDLEADVALFRKIAAVHKAALEYLSQRPRGSGINIGVRDGKGGVTRLSGAILQIDAERVEIRTGKTSEFVEWADVTAATLAEISQRGSFEPAVLAALCLLEGEREEAKALSSDLPGKWTTYAEGALAKLPKPEPNEKNARDLYAAAEKNFRSMETFAAAVENYKTLRTDFAATALVKKYAERIFRRSDAGREYYYAPADFRVEGTIQLAKSGRLESSKDSDDRDTLQNSAEIEFAVLPGLTYRCWLQIGACCEETFLFYLQGSEVTEIENKTKKKLACEPGSSYAVAVKPPIRNLKKTHEEHKIKGAKVHPKTAARWEWVEIVLPKYAAPGGKKLKFMTNQAGFSIGGACISSSRKAPPADPEVKELEKQRLVENPPMPIDPDLLAWWTFEEGAGGVVNDVSGRNHGGKLVGATQWVEGKTGGGLQVGGGPRSGVEVADTEDLRIAGDMTMALWVKQTAPSGDWVCLLGRGTTEQRNYGLWIEPETRKVLYQQYGGSVNMYGKKLIEPGQWIHLAVTIEGGTVKMYYDGQLDAQDSKPGPGHTSPAPLGIGSAIHHGSLTGVVDDVRLYRRALSADEIRALFAAK